MLRIPRDRGYRVANWLLVVVDCRRCWLSSLLVVVVVLSKRLGRVDPPGV
jgi:hypothetical protein